MTCVLPLEETANSPAEVLNAIASPVFVVDSDARIVFANTEASQMVRANQTLGQRAGDALQCEGASRSAGGCGTSPSCGQCKLRRAVAEAACGVKSKDRLHRTTWIRCGKASQVTLLISASPICWDGEKRVLVFLKDITELTVLREIVPICMCCRKVRDDESYWRGVEEYFQERMNVGFSHGVCPSCQERMMEEMASSGLARV